MLNSSLALLAPTSSVHTIATSASFSGGANGFAFPHLVRGATATATVFFTAYGDGEDESVVQVHGGKLTTVAAAGDSHKFSSVSQPTATEMAVAFVGESGASSVGLYLTMSPFSHVPTAVAAVGEAGFAAIENPTLERGNVAFGGTRGGLAGIFASRATTTATSDKRRARVHTLVNSSRAQPHRPHAKLTCLMNPAISRTFVAFFGSDCASSASRGRPSERMYRTMRRTDHALHLDDEAGVVAGIYLAKLPATTSTATTAAESESESASKNKSDGDDDGASWPPAGEAPLTRVADSTSLVPSGTPPSGTSPSGTPPSATFVAFSSPAASEALVAFVGSTSDGRIGVFTYDAADGTLRKVADTQTAVPGAAGTFADFPYPPSVSGSTVVFYGAAGGASSGLYAQTTSSDGARSLQKLVTMADTIDGAPIAFLGAGAASSDARTAVFYAVTSTNGIYTVPIH